MDHFYKKTIYVSLLSKKELRTTIFLDSNIYTFIYVVGEGGYLKNKKVSLSFLPYTVCVFKVVSLPLIHL